MSTSCILCILFSKLAQNSDPKSLIKHRASYTTGVDSLDVNDAKVCTTTLTFVPGNIVTQVTYTKKLIIFSTIIVSLCYGKSNSINVKLIVKLIYITADYFK
jgi:hypothetical protein